MRYAIYGLAAMVILGSVVVRAWPDEDNSGGTAAKALADATVSSSVTPAPPTALVGGTVEAREEQASDAPDEPGGTATPAPTTAVLEREALTVVPTQAPAPRLEESADEVGTGNASVPTEDEAERSGSIPGWGSNTLQAAIEAAFPPSQWATAYAVAMCESGGNPGAVGRAGEEGAFQVLAIYHGPVPADLYGQAVQAAGIVATQGWSPWSCARR